jgi:hypothetical protein
MSKMKKQRTDRVKAVVETAKQAPRADPRFFVPDSDSDMPCLPENLVMAIMCMAIPEDGPGIHQDDLTAIWEYYRDVYLNLHLLNAVLAGVLGIVWDEEQKQIVYYTIKDPAEIESRRSVVDAFAKNFDRHDADS